MGPRSSFLQFAESSFRESEPTLEPVGQSKFDRVNLVFLRSLRSTSIGIRQITSNCRERAHLEGKFAGWPIFNHEGGHALSEVVSLARVRVSRAQYSNNRRLRRVFSLSLRLRSHHHAQS